MVVRLICAHSSKTRIYRIVSLGSLYLSLLDFHFGVRFVTISRQTCQPLVTDIDYEAIVKLSPGRTLDAGHERVIR